MTRAIKRALDILTALCVLFILSPLISLIVIAIKLNDHGPVLFLQDRVGKDGRRFRCVKFRTTVLGVESIGSGLTVMAGDARITRLGRVLRLWTLDEIPQLLNVLWGHMSIVGPRPWVPSQAALCTAAERRRFAVRPGMAEWAWIHGRNLFEWDERIRLDVWYVDHWSLWLDFFILAKSFLLLFRRAGVYVADGAEARCVG